MTIKNNLTLAYGDRWRLDLYNRKPGETQLELHVDGEQVARVPIGNVLEPLARFDPATAGARESIVQKLRGEVSEWKSKHYENVAERAELAALRALKADADRAIADGVSLRRDRAYLLVVAVMMLIGVLILAMQNCVLESRLKKLSQPESEVMP